MSGDSDSDSDSDSASVVSDSGQESDREVIQQVIEAKKPRRAEKRGTASRIGEF